MKKIRDILLMNRYNKNITIKKYAILSYTLAFFFVSCSQKDKLNIKDQLVINEKLLTSTLNGDDFISKNTHSIYAESFIAYNEVYHNRTKSSLSINNQIDGFVKIVTATEKIDIDFSSFVAFFKVIEINKIQSKAINSEKDKIFNYSKDDLSNSKYKK